MYEDGKRTKLLLVEDDLLFAWSASVELSNAGFEVITLNSGDDPQFLTRVRESDVVVLDVSLPGISGFTLVREIRNDSVASTTPVMMLTALGPMDYQLHALSCGADDVMVKPPNWRELSARLRTLLRRAAVAG